MTKYVVYSKGKYSGMNKVVYSNRESAIREARILKKDSAFKDVRVETLKGKKIEEKKKKRSSSFGMDFGLKGWGSNFRF